QMGWLQQQPQPIQHKIYHEFAARFMPQLVKKFEESSGALNMAMSVLNVITYTPYFARYARMPGGQEITAMQFKRTLDYAVETDKTTPPADDVGEIGQFLATLMSVQGTDNIPNEDKQKLKPYLRKWKRVYRGRLASTVSERCL
ncbi:hypothetical protein FISHEDRAFT_23718, partial [Fistulina hepatica ATCC 64428]